MFFNNFLSYIIFIFFFGGTFSINGYLCCIILIEGHYFLFVERAFGNFYEYGSPW